MTHEEALELFKKQMSCRNEENCNAVCDECKYNWDADLVDEAEGLAIRALEKQIPKEPIKKYYKNVNVSYCCPICSTYIAHIVNEESFYNDEIKRANYCHCCGQAIDWEDVE